MVLTVPSLLSKTVSDYGTMFAKLSVGVVLGVLMDCGLPALASPTLSQVLRNTPQSRLQFSPDTVGSVIVGATDRVYILNALQGQALRIKVNNTGARAFVMVFDSQGRRLITLTDRSPAFEYELPRSGDYYIFCHGGLTYHFYGLVVTVNESN